MEENPDRETDGIREPRAAIAAIVDPAPLTMAQIALLERVESKVVVGNVDSVNDCLLAMWLLSMPVREAGRLTTQNDLQTLRNKAVEWADKNSIGGSEYHSRLMGLMKSCTAFWKMLPRPENKDAKKKDTETGSSRRSRSGRAGHTDGR